MRSIFAIAATAICAGPLSAGPLDTIQYRSTLLTDLPTGPGPVRNADETAYVSARSAVVGVVASGVSDWTPIWPAYPTASFAIDQVGILTPFTSSQRPNTSATADGRFALNLELASGLGKTENIVFSGEFQSGWTFSWGYVNTSIDGSGSQSLNVGGVQYDVSLSFSWLPHYANVNGQWLQGLTAPDPVFDWDGQYGQMPAGSFYVTITPTATPEPTTLLLTGLGIGGVGLGRAFRRSHV